MAENKAVQVEQAQGDSSEQVKELVREFVVENFMFGEDDGLENATSFQDAGIIDSTGILELVNFLEQQFSLKISDEELVPENLDSIQNVVRFLGGR